MGILLQTFLKNSDKQVKQLKQLKKQEQLFLNYFSIFNRISLIDLFLFLFHLTL